MGIRRTARGFRIYSEFTDSYGSRIRVQKSSNAEKTACWVFCSRGEKEDSPHLTVAQAKRLIAGLQKFVAEYE